MTVISFQVWIILELYLHSRSWSRKHFSGCFALPLKDIPRIPSAKPSLMQERQGSFKALTMDVLETKEMSLLRDRSKDDEAKRFVDRMERNAKGKAVFQMPQSLKWL